MRLQVLTPVHLHCRCDVAVVRLISSDVLAAFHGASRRVLVLDLEHVLVSNSVPFACGKALDSTTDDVRSPSASRHRRRRSSTASSATLPPVLPPCVEALCALPNTVVVILSGHSRTVVSSICAGVNAVLVAEHGCYLRYEPLCRLLCERVHPLCDDVAPCVVAWSWCVVVCRWSPWHAWESLGETEAERAGENSAQLASLCKYFASRTPRSQLEIKDRSVTFHFRECDRSLQYVVLLCMVPVGQER